MDYVKFGNTGLDVSRLCLGAMGFGDPSNWIHKWILNEEKSRPVIKKALDAGINFFDTANIYSMGESERVLGKALNDYALRDDIVVATKVFMPMRPNRPNSGGLSRKEIMAEIDQSLERLGMDYVDLYIIHRWDYHTPIEETMEALHDVIKAGKARHIGASAMFTWQFQKAHYVARENGWTPFVSMQNHYNLIYREEEREMMPFCKDQKIAVTPYSPLAAGRLTRNLTESTHRSKTDQTQKAKYDPTQEADQQIINKVAEMARHHGVTNDKIALAWLLNKEPVVAPIIGAQKESHIESAVAALDVTLTSEEMNRLEECYVPHPIVGAR
ncbi:aldo/keto reductase [Shouchella miscanthi]|uniref:aldo/keto reductase n=1 Tax=Shouchella miscanthi TaxID=2598861 RepID=UPI0011A8C08A|nr:aldo/keto reductase [Shouchella miscanthi]